MTTLASPLPTTPVVAMNKRTNGAGLYADGYGYDLRGRNVYVLEDGSWTHIGSVITMSRDARKKYAGDPDTHVSEYGRKLKRRFFTAVTPKIYSRTYEFRGERRTYAFSKTLGTRFETRQDAIRALVATHYGVDFDRGF